MIQPFCPVIIKFKVRDLIKWEQLRYKIFGSVADGGLLSTDDKDVKAFKNKNQLALLTDEAVNCLDILEVRQC